MQKPKQPSQKFCLHWNMNFQITSNSIKRSRTCVVCTELRTPATQCTHRRRRIVLSTQSVRTLISLFYRQIQVKFFVLSVCVCMRACLCVCVYVLMYMLIICAGLFSGMYLNGNLRVEVTWNSVTPLVTKRKISAFQSLNLPHSTVKLLD